MTSVKEIEQKIMEIKPKLKDDFGIEKIGYFGSFATNTHREDSDIDIMVSLPKNIGWKFFDLKEYLEEVLDRKVDLVTEGSIRDKWKEDILSQLRYI